MTARGGATAAPRLRVGAVPRGPQLILRRRQALADDVGRRPRRRRGRGGPGLARDGELPARRRSRSVAMRTSRVDRGRGGRRTRRRRRARRLVVLRCFADGVEESFGAVQDARHRPLLLRRDLGSAGAGGGGAGQRQEGERHARFFRFGAASACPSLVPAAHRVGRRRNTKNISRQRPCLRPVVHAAVTFGGSFVHGKFIARRYVALRPALRPSTRALTTSKEDLRACFVFCNGPESAGSPSSSPCWRPPC